MVFATGLRTQRVWLLNRREDHRSMVRALVGRVTFVSAICMTSAIAKEGIAGCLGEDHCDDCR